MRKRCLGNLDEPRWYFDEDTPVDQRLAEQFMYGLKNFKRP